MNRKETIVVAALLLITFVGSAFAAPAVQQMLIVNDPLNVKIVGRPPLLQTAGLDIEVLNITPQGLFGGSSTNGVFVCNYCPIVNLTAGFAFTPMGGFVEVASILLTVHYYALTQATPRELSIRLNSGTTTTIPMLYLGLPAITAADLSPQDIRVGQNLIEIGVAGNQVQAQLFEVRLTIEYTFMD